MKKFFILLIVVLMLAGLTFTSFAAKPDNPRWNGNEHAYDQDGTPLRDCVVTDWPNPDECVPIGDEHKYKWGK